MLVKTFNPDQLRKCKYVKTKIYLLCHNLGWKYPLYYHKNANFAQYYFRFFTTCIDEFPLTV